MQNRIDALDWSGIRQALNRQGWAEIPGVLTSEQCDELTSLWPDESLFRSEVNMQRHNFGRGRYRYFTYPLPTLIEQARQRLYRHLVPVANDWMAKLKQPHIYPETLPAFLNQCHQAGQTRPTPLMLEYGPEDYNRLHQDQYGPLAFPLQAVLMLSDHNDFEGGQFVMTETRPRTQTRAHVLSPDQGTIVIFAGSRRPVPSVRGYSAITLRHGVSEVFSGHRKTLGLIFHDAT